MTAEIVVLLLLLAATLISGALAALILSALDTIGWAVILALFVSGLLAWRLIAAHLAASSGFAGEDLADEWHAS